MSDLETLVARLDRLEAENAALRSRVRVLEQADPVANGDPAPPDTAVSRRALLRRASVGAGSLALGAVAATAATLGQARPVSAGGPNPPTVFESTSAAAAVVGENVKTSSPAGAGVLGISKHGVGVKGESDVSDGIHGIGFGGDGGGVLGSAFSGGAYGVKGLAGGSGPAILGLKNESDGIAVHGRINRSASPSAAVYGQTNGSGTGVLGESASGDGVVGATGPGRGVYGYSSTGAGGVVGEHNGNGNGIVGLSFGGRGGRFRGPKAQIKLDPSTATTHPPSGQRGDLFVDKRGRLWFCKGGTTWRQLA